MKINLIVGKYYKWSEEECFAIFQVLNKDYSTNPPHIQIKWVVAHNCANAGTEWLPEDLIQNRAVVIKEIQDWEVTLELMKI